MNIVKCEFIKRAPSDLSAQLRALADAVDQGCITGLVAAYVRMGEYEMLHSASLSESLVMATLPQRQCADRFIF